MKNNLKQIRNNWWKKHHQKNVSQACSGVMDFSEDNYEILSRLVHVQPTIKKYKLRFSFFVYSTSSV